MGRGDPPQLPGYEMIDSNRTPGTGSSGGQLFLLNPLPGMPARAVTPHNSAAYGMSTNGFVCGSVEMVGPVGTIYQTVKRPTIWARSGTNGPGGSTMGMIAFFLPHAFDKGIHSELRGISHDQRKNPIGQVVTNSNPLTISYRITAVGYADTDAIKSGSIYISKSPHAIIAVISPDAYDYYLQTDWYVNDLNDATLVKGLGNRVLTDAIAINQTGYILTKTNDGNTYLLVPLVY